MNKKEELKNEFPRIKENVLLKDYTTFKIGGEAKYFLKTSDVKELKRIIQKVIKLKIKFIVIGSGSNILFSSKGFNGLVISYKQDNNIDSIVREKIDEDNYIVKVDASILLNSLIRELKDLSGLEWGIGIPGTLGGAINGNAGAFGESISDTILSVDVLEIKDNGEIIEKKYSPKNCLFAYRTSVFKKNNNLLILKASIKMIKDDPNLIEERIKENISKRIIKQPKGFSAGSIFKNYYGKINKEIILKYPDLDQKKIISAGLLIDLLNLKGKRIGDAKISEEHGNFIINLGNATSEDVIKLIKFIKKEVRKNFLINLEEEIKFFK